MDATRKCKICEETKPIDHYECTTKDGKCRRAVCKPCYQKKKAEIAKKKSKEIDRTTVPKPNCSECGKTYPEVDFAWRDDVAQGGWRSVCRTCYNTRGYSEKSRVKRRAEDEKGFLEKNAEQARKWREKNPEKVKEQEYKTRVIPEKRWRVFLNYIRSKHGKDNLHLYIRLEESELLQAKMTKPCFYCNHMPKENETLNGLDKVNPKGIYEDANTVPCCGVCNNIKSTFHVDEFIQGVREIYHNNYHIIETYEEVHRPINLSGDNSRREFDIDKGDLTQEDKVDLYVDACYLCGRSPAFGIDRVDPKIGYVIDNCKPCCYMCNYMKKDFKLEEFLGHIYRIHSHTSYWIIGDTSDKMTFMSTSRNPVKPIGLDIIFPSHYKAELCLGLGKKLIYNRIKNGHKIFGYNWEYCPISEYKRQCISKQDCLDMIRKLRNN